MPLALRRALPLLIASGLLAGCPRRMPAPAEALELAALEAEGPSPGARALALAGFHAYLLRGEPQKARERFEASLERDSAEPYALQGLWLLATREGHPERALDYALKLCERAPSHPLSTAAARYVLDSVGTATSTDQQVLQRAPSAIEHGAAGDVAHLLRAAIARVHANRRESAARAAALAAMGAPTTFTLLGPLSAYHVLSFDELTEPERTGSLEGPLAGPYGPLSPRTMSFPDGTFSLAAEPPQGDGYLLGVDLEVQEEADYVVRTISSAPHKAYLDGTLLFSRRSFERVLPTVSAFGVKLSPGKHRLLLRLSKDEGSASLAVAVLRADGRPSRLAFSAAKGVAPRWAGVPPAEVPLVYPGASQFSAALRPEAGEVLARYLAARDGMGRDRDGAKRVASPLSSALSGAALSGLMADIALGDRTVPQKVARGRATRDLEATIEGDKGDVHALLQSATLALEDGRHAEGAELVQRARAAASPAGFPVAMLEARLQLALGVDAEAEKAAQQAEQSLPGLCDALSLRYDVARRRDAAELADRLLKGLWHCPGSLTREAEHARSRGALEPAAASYEELVAQDPSHVPTASALVDLYVSLRRYEKASAVLSGLRELWPRNAALAKRAADVHEFAGRPELALAERERALALDGGDLLLRRIVERAKTGGEPLSSHAIDGKAAIAAYERAPRNEETVSAYILDAAAVRAYPDGSTLDRIHIVQKALDQSGVADVAEVNLPAGSYVLALRTIKPDGTVLEPESIEGKESVSLPGVQVGDYVEYEYLQANAPRGPAQPGFTASSFYFQIAKQPNNWSTYAVVAPKGTKLSVDAHNMKAPKPERRGEEEVFFHEERAVPPYIPEPNGPPSANEYLPFVSVGAGTEGNEGVVAAYADAYLDRGLLSFEVEEFALKATSGKTGLEAVRALYAAVMEKLQGRDSGLNLSAAASLAQDRGSRLWALKASLEAIGVPARLAAVRTFSTDPAAYRFPNEGLLPYVCVRVELPGGEVVWLDPAVRYGPFGELPEQASGERQAYLLPEPGRPLSKVKTPPKTERLGKLVSLSLRLEPDGTLAGEGEESYSGFEAAQLAEALEALSPDQRDQALQSALSRYFGGAELSSVKLDIHREVGAPLKVRYEFKAPRFARQESDGKLVLGSVTFPAYLGRRFVQVGSRRTPLYIDSTESSVTKATLELPAGFKLQDLLPEAKANGRYGRFVRRERVEGEKLLIEEEYRLEMARVPVDQYEDFGRFAGEVDLIQARDLVVTSGR
ncbi:MAG: hypothetical protein HYZ28_25185 [Myxococcales bacterium]|nr:hypothetical protein [Myxococcales bacterium]